MAPKRNRTRARTTAAPSTVRNPAAVYRTARRSGGTIVSERILSGQIYYERRRINPKKGPVLAKGRELSGNAEDLFMGSIEDRGKGTRKARREKWIRNFKRTRPI